jgi:HK97 family phage major capsid protein
LDEKKTRLKELSEEARELTRKARSTGGADGFELSDADAQRAEALADEHWALSEEVAKAEANAEKVTKFMQFVAPDSARESTGTVARTAAFTAPIMAAFKADAQARVSKGLLSAGEVKPAWDGRILTDPKQRFSVAAALPTRSVTSGSGSYLQQSLRENNAATVARGGFKPTSRYEFVEADWRLATVATLSEPIPEQWLEDYTGLQGVLTSELAYAVDAAVNDFILNGGTTEDGEVNKGLLNVAGVETVAALERPEDSIRRAITLLENQGTDPGHIILSAADWETIEVARDANGKPLYSDTPVDRLNQKLWGIPVITPAQMPAGTAIVGDLSTVSVLNNGTHRLSWRDSYANVGTVEAPKEVDLYATNQVQFRDEVRVGLEVTSTKTWRRVGLVAGE